MKNYLAKHIFIVLLIFACSLSAQAKNVIKVLAIGNSFSEDAVENYLYELAKAAGDSLVIGNLYIGGCSLETHSKNAVSDAPAYSYRKIVGGIKTVKEKQTLSTAIQDEPWDYISFQQVSQNSGIYATYFPYLTDLLIYVKSKVTNPHVRFVLHRTWAYAQNSTHGGFVNYSKDQNAMYRAIVDATRKVVKDVPEIKFLIPSGTAIQNARSSSIGDNFCRDGYHLELTYGRYTAACTWFEALTGKNVINNTYAPKTIDKFTAAAARQAAHYAIKSPDKVTSMAGFSGGR